MHVIAGKISQTLQPQRQVKLARLGWCHR